MRQFCHACLLHDYIIKNHFLKDTHIMTSRNNMSSNINVHIYYTLTLLSFQAYIYIYIERCQEIKGTQGNKKYNCNNQIQIKVLFLVSIRNTYGITGGRVNKLQIQVRNPRYFLSADIQQFFKGLVYQMKLLRHILKSLFQR